MSRKFGVAFSPICHISRIEHSMIKCARIYDRSMSYIIHCLYMHAVFMFVLPCIFYSLYTYWGISRQYSRELNMWGNLRKPRSLLLKKQARFLYLQNPLEYWRFCDANWWLSKKIKSLANSSTALKLLSSQLS